MDKGSTEGGYNAGGRKYRDMDAAVRDERATEGLGSVCSLVYAAR